MELRVPSTPSANRSRDGPPTRGCLSVLGATAPRRAGDRSAPSASVSPLNRWAIPV